MDERTQQAIINVGLKQDSSLKLADLEEELRKKLPQQFPEATVLLRPGDLISQILSFGSSSLAEVDRCWAAVCRCRELRGTSPSKAGYGSRAP